MNSVQRKITAALLISTFLAAIEVTIISTAMPRIAESLGGIELMSWVFAIYLLTTAVSTPIWGKLADLIGRKAVFMTGVVVFLTGSLLCGLSQTMEILILFRAIQGIGAGALNPVTFTIIADVFSFEQRAKVQGLVSSMWGIAGIFGPLVGGFLVDFISWHWVFFINIPFGLVSMWMIGRHFKETLEKRKRKIDVWGALTFTVGMTAFLFAMLSADTEAGYDVSRPVLFGLYAAAFVFLAVFVFIQKNHEEPMMPLYLFKNRNVAIANAASFLNSAILIGLTAYLPLWTQRVLEMGATASGFTLMPLCIGWLFGSMLCAALLKRLGTKGIAVLGVALIALGAISLAGISASTPLWFIAFCILLCGHGFGLSFTVFTLVIQSSVPLHNRGSAGSLNSLLRTLGQTIGVAVLGTALNAYLPDRIAEGLHAVFFLSAAIGIASLFITLWIPKQTQEQIERQLS